MSKTRIGNYINATIKSYMNMGNVGKIKKKKKKKEEENNFRQIVICESDFRTLKVLLVPKSLGLIVFGIEFPVD